MTRSLRLFSLICPAILTCLWPAQVCSAQAVPNGFIRVHGTSILNVVGVPVPSATLCTQVTAVGGQSISANLSVGGQATRPPVCVPVVNGAFTINLPDTSQTNPRNVCIAFSARDTLTYDLLLDDGYGCVQPTSAPSVVSPSMSPAWCTVAAGVADCNFDLYQPNLPALALVQTGPKGEQGLPGSPGAIGPTGSTTASGAAGGFAVPGNLSIGNGTILNNNAGSASFIGLFDSLGLPVDSGAPKTLANLLQIPPSNQHINSIGSASLPDLFSCSTSAGCSPGGAYPYQVGHYPLSFPLGITSNTITVIDLAKNDLSNMSNIPGPATLDYFHGGYLAWLIELGVPDAQKLTAAANCTQTSGTWTAAAGNFPAGSLQSTGTGSLTCTGYNATSAGVISYKRVGSSTAAYTVSITNAGISYSAFDPYTNSATFNQAGTYTTAWGGTANLYAAGQSGMGGGYTTVVYRCTAASSSDPCVVAAPYFLSNSSSLQNAPQVAVQLLSRDSQNGTCCGGTVQGDYNINIMRQEQQKAVKELHDNGLNVIAFDPNATPVGYNSSTVGQGGKVNYVTVTSGGSGYTSGTVSFSGPCTVTPAVAPIPVVSGALVTGVYYTTSIGSCTGSPTVFFTGGGTGAAGSAYYIYDGTHPNATGSANMAAVAFAALNGAVTAQDRDAHTNGISYINNQLFVGPVPASGFTSDPSYVVQQPGSMNINTQLYTGNPQTGRLSMGDARSWIERLPDAGGNHYWQIAGADAGIHFFSSNQFRLTPAGSGAYNLGLAGTTQYSLASFGSGFGAGLNGVVGLFDPATSAFIWSMCGNDDLYGGVPISGGNACGHAGSTWHITLSGDAVFHTVSAQNGFTGKCVYPQTPDVTGGIVTGCS